MSASFKSLSNSINHRINLQRISRRTRKTKDTLCDVGSGYFILSLDHITCNGMLCMVFTRLNVPINLKNCLNAQDFLFVLFGQINMRPCNWQRCSLQHSVSPLLFLSPLCFGNVNDITGSVICNIYNRLILSRIFTYLVKPCQTWSQRVGSPRHA